MSVLDIQLRGQIHKSVLGKLIPAYDSFLEKFSSHLQSRRFKERYIKYSSQDLENKLKFLFAEHWPSDGSGIDTLHLFYYQMPNQTFIYTVSLLT